MKKIFMVILLVVTTQIKAQDTLNGRCWTPEMDTTEFKNLPWYDNNDFLERFLDTIGYPSAGGGYRIVGTPVKYWIPIKFWIYRNDDGTGGPNPTHLQTLLDDLNRRYNQTNNAMIGFYMKCDPTYINNSSHVTKTFTGATILMAANNIKGCINVHIIGSFASTGTSGYSISNLNASMVPNTSYLDTRYNGDLAHEIGHVLGLPHTHQFSAWNSKCFTECVSRTRTWPTFNLCPTRILSNKVCESTGDGLRDTQADDNLIGNNDCSYNKILGNDEWGDSYDNPPAGLQDRPNVFNIMSYNTATDCVEQFSRLQIAAMLWTIKWQKSYHAGWGNPITTFDNFEPDNESITAREITTNQVQERNFHQQYNFNSTQEYDYYSQCDVDWARFTPTCSNTFDVQTFAIPGQINANTKLTLFDANLNQLAQNDDISSTDLFSKISFNFVDGQTYFIRIENMSANVTGYYNLSVGPEFTIAGNASICTSNNYSINNLPAGAIVTWSASPSAIVQFSCTTCSQPTVTAIGNGTVSISATINSSCGNATVTKQNIAIGPSVISGSYTYTDYPYGSPMGLVEATEDNEICYISAPTEMNTVMDISGATSVVWEKNSSTPSTLLWDQIGDDLQVTFRGLNQTGSFKITASNTCGSVSKDYIFKSVTCSQMFSVSPNPTTGSVQVSSTDKKTTIKEIRVTSKTGSIKKDITYTNKITSAVIDISLLPPDIYYIQIFDGKKWTSKIISKQ